MASCAPAVCCKGTAALGVSQGSLSSSAPNFYSMNTTPLRTIAMHRQVSSTQLTKRISSSFLARRPQRQTRLLLGTVRAHTEAEVADIDRSTCPKVKDQISLSDFEKVDLRVGLVTDARAVPDKEMTEKRGKPTMSRKYLQLKVDIGAETRTVVSECKYVIDVEDAVGKKVLFVANLPPTEVEGIQSHGIILQGLNYDPTPMPRSFKVILPGLGRLPPGSSVIGASIPR